MDESYSAEERLYYPYYHPYLSTWRHYMYPSFYSHPDLNQLVNISGEWQTNYGRMTLNLQQDKITVIGTYGDPSWNGEIHAFLRGNKLSGHWSRKRPQYAAGKIEFTFPNAYEFTGRWSSGTDPAFKGEWNGRRIR